MSATAVATEDGLLARYEQLVKDRSRIADQVDQAEAKLGTLDRERQALLPRIADGDKAASGRVDALDAEIVVARRQVDGLRMKLGEHDSSIGELGVQRSEILQRRADEAQRARAESYRARLAKHTHNTIALWRRLSRECYEQSELVREIELDGSLKERQRQELVNEVLVARHEQNGVYHNEHWLPSNGSLGPFGQQIVAAKPPDAKKHLEELK